MRVEPLFKLLATTDISPKITADITCPINKKMAHSMYVSKVFGPFSDPIKRNTELYIEIQYLFPNYASYNTVSSSIESAGGVQILFIFTTKYQIQPMQCKYISRISANCKSLTFSFISSFALIYRIILFNLRILISFINPSSLKLKF